MPKIVHIKKATPGTFKPVDRSTVYGNPYSHKKGTKATFVVSSIEEAVDKYEEYYHAPEQEWLRNRARKELKGHDLGCWGCSPCHASIILKDVNDV